MASLFSLEPLPGLNPYQIASCGLTGLSDNPSMSIINPAIGANGIAVSTSYPFGMEELQQSELSGTMLYKNSGLFAGWQTLSNVDYERNDYRLGFRTISGNHHFGTGIKLCYDQISGYGSETANWVYTGYRFKFSDSTFDMSVDYIDLFQDSRCPPRRSYDFSIGQGFAESGIMAFGMNLMRGMKPDYKVGCRYSVYPGMQAIISWESEPGRFGVGTMYNIRFLDVMYAAQSHPELNWTHSVGLSVRFP